MESKPFIKLMSFPTSSCTGSVAVLQSYQQAVQRHSSTESPLSKPRAQPHKLCTVVENGQVVVRPVESSKAESDELVRCRESFCNQ
jgi:hypothetical protein